MLAAVVAMCCLLDFFHSPMLHKEGTNKLREKNQHLNHTPADNSGSALDSTKVQQLFCRHKTDEQTKTPEQPQKSHQLIMPHIRLKPASFQHSRRDIIVSPRPPPLYAKKGKKRTRVCS